MTWSVFFLLLMSILSFNTVQYPILLFYLSERWLYGLFCLISMYELIWLNSAAIIIYYIYCTNDTILLYGNIFFDEKKVFTAGLCLQPVVLMSPSPTVPDTNWRWWVHITNGSGTDDDGPAITNDLNPTAPKIVGDVLLEPAVIGVVVVVQFDRSLPTARFSGFSLR